MTLSVDCITGENVIGRLSFNVESITSELHKTWPLIVNDSHHAYAFDFVVSGKI
jgi:hypothetical protein